MKHEAALRALAFKWIRILHRCWTDRIPYDQSHYLLALKKRHGPVAQVCCRVSDLTSPFFAVSLRA
jgi:hypothetical protein